MHESVAGAELPVLKPLTCMPGIYGEADTNLELRGVGKVDRNWHSADSARKCEYSQYGLTEAPG